eukprot:gnl/TRDRNA2_/TRDRNA2_42750_c0_seq1.p1 gnl/TRDRNA2_/TRDRNA2_42750_c0~~gnl/TRDRNA2_/TRDRNA2_42750_c0_seq1.p1  ORF type:complete len:314 (+),score=42.82 gnl/TRDRNA2_/TRDRNA2_42750_c0_seq1:64-942(+)
MVAAQSQVVGQLAGGWLQCMDDEGTYYYNSITQQTSDELPADLERQQFVDLSSRQQSSGDKVGGHVLAVHAKVLEKLPNGWLQCQEYGEVSGQLNPPYIFYYNSMTDQSCVDLPSELREQFEVNGWLPCHDAEGPYYYHVATQETYTDLPEELRRAPSHVPPSQVRSSPAEVARQAQVARQAKQNSRGAVAQAAPRTWEALMSGQATLLGEFAHGWLRCEDVQGIYYYNLDTKKASNNLPRALMFSGDPEELPASQGAYDALGVLKRGGRVAHNSADMGRLPLYGCWPETFP